MKVKIDYTSKEVIILEDAPIFQYSHNTDYIEIMLDHYEPGLVYKMNFTDASGVKNNSRYLEFIGYVDNFYYFRIPLNSTNTKYAGDLKMSVSEYTQEVDGEVTTTTKIWNSETFVKHINESEEDDTVDINAEETTILNEIYAAIALKLKEEHKGYYFANADLGISGTLTTQAYVAAVANALTNSGGSYLFSGTAMIQNDGVVISDQPTLADEVLMILNTDDALSINSVNGILLASRSKSSGFNLYYANFNILSGTTTVTAWRRILTDVDLTNLTDGTTTVKKAEQDASGDVITTTYETKDNATTERAKKADLAGGNAFTGNQTLDDNLQVNKESYFLGKAYFNVLSRFKGADLFNEKIINLASGTANNDAVNKSQLDTVYAEFKQRKIIGIDLQNDILLTEFKTALGLATTALSGLMSATDKSRLDALHALLEEDETNSVVDSINEILAIFESYPEGAALVTALAGKVDKVEGKGLSANDYSDSEKNTVASAKTHYETTDGTNPHQVKFVNINDKPSTLAGFGITDAMTEAEIMAQINSLKAIYGWESSDLGELDDGENISAAIIDEYDLIILTAYDVIGGQKHYVTQSFKPSQITVGDRIWLGLTYNATDYYKAHFNKPSTSQYNFAVASETLDAKCVITGIKMDKSQFNEIRNIEDQTITYRTDGKVSQVVGDNVTTTPTYDANGNLTKITEVYSLDGKTYETTFVRDALGRIINTNKQEVI